MKKLLMLMMVCNFYIWGGSGKSAKETQSLAKTYEVSQNVILVNVKGMVCDFCAQGLKKKFGVVDEVKSIDVDLESGNVLIFLKPGKKLSDDIIKKAVNENGLEVLSIKKKA